MKQLIFILLSMLLGGCSDNPVYKNVMDEAFSFCKDKEGVRYLQFDPFMSPYPSKLFKIVCQNGKVTWAGSEVKS